MSRARRRGGGGAPRRRVIGAGADLRGASVTGPGGRAGDEDPVGRVEGDADHFLAGVAALGRVDRSTYIRQRTTCRLWRLQLVMPYLTQWTS